MMTTLRDGGYTGVVLLMALESSIVPVPSELIVPPAAFWAAQGQMSMPLVLVAATFGSWIGSSICYWVSAWVGRPIVASLGRYVGITEHGLQTAEAWVAAYGMGGIFFSRLLPVIRHLISIPAGILRMDYLRFSLMTVLGAGLWACVLAFFGVQILTPDMLSGDPNVVIHAVKAKMHWIVALVVVFAGLYAVMRWLVSRSQVRKESA
jgi:membrane protein DedA with SNARE-associated domain